MIDAASVALGVALGWILALSTSSQDGDSADSVSAFLDQRRTSLQDRYAAGDLDHETFADRIALLEAPDTERIMRDAVRVDGIGPKTAYSVVKVCDGNWQRYREAEPMALKAINGVGENRAHALTNR